MKFSRPHTCYLGRPRIPQSDAWQGLVSSALLGSEDDTLLTSAALELYALPNIKHLPDYPHSTEPKAVVAYAKANASRERVGLYQSRRLYQKLEPMMTSARGRKEADITVMIDDTKLRKLFKSLRNPLYPVDYAIHLSYWDKEYYLVYESWAKGFGRAFSESHVLEKIKRHSGFVEEDIGLGVKRICKDEIIEAV